MKKQFILYIILCSTTILLAQNRSRADRFFEKGDFINAAKYYEEDLERIQHKKDLENISISYYNIFNYRDASRHLKRLINGRFVESDKTVDNVFYFKLYQVLSALGDYEAGLEYYKIYKNNLSADLDVVDAIETVEAFRLMNPDYTVDLVEFNSEAADFGALKFGDSIYFASDRGSGEILPKTYKWTHRPFLDIYSLFASPKLSPFGEVTAMSSDINSKLHEGNFCFADNGNTLYVSKSHTVDGKQVFDDDEKNNIHLYVSYKKEGKWSEWESLPFNTNGFSYQHPSLSPDGDYLYFSSNQDGGYGSFDLYRVKVEVDDTFGLPENLGPNINTENREHFPFISSDGHLFFSSNGHLGLGMLDNFVSELVNGRFTKPINLGVPINSRYDDFNLNYYNDTEGFFASNRNKNDDNIYSFEQFGEIFIREYINIFEIRDRETDSFVSNTEVILKDKKGEEIYSNTLDSIARFSRNLLAGNYELIAKNDAYLPGQKFVIVKEEKDQKHVLYLQKLPPPPPVDPVEKVIAEKGIDKHMKQDDPKRFEMLTDTDGPPIIEKDGKLFFDLQPIYFDFDMWNIRQDSRVILDELSAKLERYPDIRLKISSHTDSRGSVQYNQVLSERRAESTRNYLALEGFVNARRLQFQGYGELSPVIECPNNNCTEEEHQLNRRSEFEIIRY